MIISPNRILRCLVYTIFLGIVSSLAISLIFNYAIYVAVSSVCLLLDLYIWWWCFMGSGNDPFVGGGRKSNFGGGYDGRGGWENKRGGGGFADTGLTSVTETYMPEPGPNTIAMNRIVRIAFTYSDGKTQAVLKLDPEAIRARGGYSLGSAASCDYTISDRSIAPKHARLYTAGDNILCIENLGNNNGIQVNGRYLAYGESAAFPKVGTIFLGGARLDFRG